MFSTWDSKMTDNDGRWERDVLEKLAMEALKEQRRSRRWGIFFKLLLFAYVTFAVLVAIDWKSRAARKGGTPRSSRLPA